MAKTKLYTADIIRDGTTDIVVVDVRSLPYGRFDAAHPLVITGDVDMGNGKKRPLPDFSNVIIKGAFDCSNFSISPSTVLPAGITKLICCFSINSFDVLVKILPETVQTVVVRSAMLNSVKKNERKELEDAKWFMKKHPNVVVTDGKKFLSDVVAEATAPRVVETVVNKKTIEPATKSVKPVLPIKTKDWLSTKELYDLCRQDKYIATYMTKDEVKRYIKMSKSNKTGIELTKAEMYVMNDDKNTLNCVHIDDAQKVVKFVRETHQTLKSGTLSKPESEKQNDVKAPVVAPSDQPKKLYIGSKEVTETVIKKYIKISVWKSICGHRKNINKQLEFLQAIERINVNPVDTHGDSVYYIENGQLQTSLTHTFKNQRYITQSFGKLDNNKRVMWYTGNQGEFIAVDYFKDHGKSQKQEYKQNIRDRDGQYDLSDTLFVPDLIKQLTAEKENKQIKPVNAFASEPVASEPVASEPVVSEPVVSDIVPVTSDVKPAPRKRGRPKGVKNKPKTIDAKPEEAITVQVAEQKIDSGVEILDLHKEQVPNWGDITGLRASLQDKHNILQNKIEYLIQEITYESSIDEKLIKTEQLHMTLLEQKDCQTALEKLNDLNSQLEKLKQDVMKLM